MRSILINLKTQIKIMQSDKQYWDAIMQRYFSGCNDKDVLQKQSKRKKCLTLKVVKKNFESDNNVWRGQKTNTRYVAE